MGFKTINQAEKSIDKPKRLAVGKQRVKREKKKKEGRKICFPYFKQKELSLLLFICSLQIEQDRTLFERQLSSTYFIRRLFGYTRNEAYSRLHGGGRCKELKIS